MREVIRAYRLKVKLIEDQAQGAIEKVFLRPVLDSKTLAGIPGQVLAEIRPAVKLALNEGVKFGTYIKGQVKQRA
jgi:hypothetical protein